jgi:hypothetical protein
LSARFGGPRSAGALACLCAALLIPGAAEGTPGRPAADTIPTVEEIRSLLEPEGDRAAGMAAVRARARSLPPARATLWIQLLASVERTDPALAPVLVDAVDRADRGRGAEGTDLLEGALDRAAEEDRSTLLALGAAMADGGDPERAARLRVRLLEEHPGSLEAPEAALRHARWLGESGGDREGALRLLEELIVERPNHPVTPAARALFQKWSRG